MKIPLFLPFIYKHLRKHLSPKKTLIPLLHSHITTFTLFSLIFLCTSNNVIAEEKTFQPNQEPIQIIASINNAPFSFALPNGNITGLYVEFWRLWSKVNNTPIQIKLTTLSNGIELVKNKKAIHAGLFYSQKRAQWADFSIPFHQIDTGILFNEGYNSKLKLSQQCDIVVAAHKQSYQAEYIKTNHPLLNLKTEDDNDIIFNQLLHEDIHAIIAEIPFLKSQVATRRLNGIFKFSDEILARNLVHALIAQGQPELLNKINSGIENIPIQSIVNLEKKWLPSQESFFSDGEIFSLLTTKEKHWIINHLNFSLGSDTSWYPFDFLDNNGIYTGIAADYVEHVSNMLNIKFETIRGQKWNTLLEDTIKGNVDVMAAVAITEERKKLLNFTEPYFKAPIVIVTNKNSFYADNMKSLNGKTLAIVKGFAMNDWVKKDFPDINIVPVNSIVEGLEKVNSGEIDAYTGAIAVINYEIKNRKLYNIQISAFAPYDFEIAMAVRKGLEPLVPILNKVFSEMSENQKASIANNWLAVKIENGTSLSKILLYVAPILLALMLIIFIIMRLNKRLKNEINNRIIVEEKLTHLTQHDELTGLANWRLFEKLSTEVLSSINTKSLNQALLFIDIDGFKEVNDSYGHKTGDLLLIAIAKRLKSCLTSNQIIARIGGDEFIIYLSDNLAKNETQNIVNKILKSIASPYSFEGTTVNISASIGISLAPQDGSDLEKLIKNADAAMYKAKESGKNTFHYFND